MTKGVVERRMDQQQQKKKRGKPFPPPPFIVEKLKTHFYNTQVSPLVHKLSSISIGTRPPFKKKKSPLALLRPFPKREVPKGLISSARICKACQLQMKFWTESDGSFKVYNGIKTLSVPDDSKFVEYYCGGCGDGYVFEKPKAC